VVQRGFRADLVEVDSHRLRRVEGAGDRFLGEAEQPARILVLNSLIVPAHERMFA
jgi:hypothetical protein